ncbi:GrdX family protein [Syntrophomonas erecta]
MKRGEILVITNNLMVKNMSDIKVSFIDGDGREVLYQTLNKVAGGHRLLSHPLAGSLKPDQNPFKSILVSQEKGQVNQSEIAVLHRSLEKMENMVEGGCRINKKPIYKDLQVIDQSLLASALEAFI